MRIIYVIFALALLAAPYATHAQVGIFLPCTGDKAKSEGRRTYIARHLNANTVGMRTDDIEDLYCVTRVKCVALGHCKADSPEEQAEAEKLKREMDAEQARLQRERHQKEAEAQRRRKAIEDERQVEQARKAEQVRVEMQRFNAPPGKEKEVQELLQVRERIERRTPKMCRTNATKDVIEFDSLQGVGMFGVSRSRAEKMHAQMRATGGSCRYGPLVCKDPPGSTTPAAGCSVTRECPAEDYPCPSNAQ